MKRILVPTDFSANALKAGLYAADICKKTGASLFILYTTRLDFPTVPELPVPPVPNDDAQEAINRFAADIQKEYKSISIRTFVAYEGEVVDSIIHFSQDEAIDLIVMGTKGATGLKEVFLGTTTANVIDQSAVPVLAIPATYPLNEPQAVVFATNHFENDGSLLNYLSELVQSFHTQVHIVTYVNSTEAAASEYIDAKQRLSRYANTIQTLFPQQQVKATLIEGPDFEEALKLYSEKEKINMLALVAYPKTGIEKVLHKSTSRKIASHTKIPVLVMPANG